MRLPSLLLVMLSIFFIGCAKPDPEFLKTEELRISTYATKSSEDYAYCSVSIYDASHPNVIYELEENSLVACNGTAATWYPDSKSYFAFFSHPGTEPIKLTIIRPKAGTTVINYIELQ